MVCLYVSEYIFGFFVLYYPWFNTYTQSTMVKSIMLVLLYGVYVCVHGETHMGPGFSLHGLDTMYTHVHVHTHTCTYMHAEAHMMCTHCTSTTTVIEILEILESLTKITFSFMMIHTCMRVWSI